MSRADAGDRPIRVRDVTGTAYAMWRCVSCGEMGRLTRRLPLACPGCGDPREHLVYWAED